MPTEIRACRACGRLANEQPASRRQRRCTVCECRDPAQQAPAHEKPVLLRPMAPVAAAVADALEACGWDGSVDRIGGDIRLPNDGPTVGRVVIEIVPYTGLVVEGQVKRVSPAAFLQGLRASWNAALQPDQPAPAAPEMGVVVLDEAGSREERRRSTRTPWPWEQQP